MKDLTITFRPLILFKVLSGLNRRMVLSTDPELDDPPEPVASPYMN